MQTQKQLVKYPKRGEIYIADLNPSFGREIHKKRPVLVISDNTLNQVLPSVIIIPLSSIIPQFIGPDIVRLNNQRGLDKPSVIVVNQIRSVDKNRLVKKVSNLSRINLEAVEEAIKIALHLSI